ncbi:MAG: cytochrome c biogenesis protein CcsA [Planctomycetaceae bacterium]|nr:cytochrome c biogenesis protein CcsA [Planctomycetaceae bacterium]
MLSISHIMTWLSHVSETCFTACYALVMVLEISRLFFRVAVRHALVLAITAAGLFAHIVWFCLSARTTTTTPLVSWYGWCMLIALALVFVYLWLRIQYPDKSVGLFLLPMVIGVIGTALVFLSDQEPIVTKASLSFWSILHGMALLLGSIAATLGFIAGIMYLVQSFRLKRKLPPRQGLRLPSLEQLQRYNYWLLTLSTGLLATGLLAGIIRKACLSFAAETSAPWNPIVVISSVLLLLWLIITGLFEYFYKPARQGKKVAYLTVTSFILLGAVMVLVFSTEHAVKIENATSQTLNSSSTSGNQGVQE